jgi:uncharacterized protein YjbJ (UPF0337 family)
MNWDRIEGNWKQLRGKLLEQWGKLTDDELNMIGGRREVLAGRIQELYGVSKDEAEKQIGNFERMVSEHEPKRPDRGTRDEARAPQPQR